MPRLPGPSQDDVRDTVFPHEGRNGADQIGSFEGQGRAPQLPGQVQVVANLTLGGSIGVFDRLTRRLHEFSSSSANNGSGFEGLGDTFGANDNPTPAPSSVPWDIVTGLVMLIGRLIPVIAPLALAASLAAKKPTPFTVGTMRTDTFTFGFVLLGTIILVGALLFLPVAALGPVAEHLGPIPFGG